MTGTASAGASLRHPTMRVPSALTKSKLPMARSGCHERPGKEPGAVRRTQSVVGRRLVASLCAAAMSAAALSAAAAEQLRPPHSERADRTPVHHAGRWLVDWQGRAVIDHGFNVVAKLAPYDPAKVGFGADDARFMAAHGFTAVRLGVLMAALEPAPGRFDDRYLRSVAGTVHLLAGYGIRSLLDFHQDLFNERYQGEGLPGWMAQDDGLPAQPTAGFPGNYF